MWKRNIIIAVKVFIQLILLVIFLKYIGLDAIDRYHEENTMIVKSRRQTGGIEGPTITVVPKHNTTKTGWRHETEELDSFADVMYKKCKDFEEFKTLQNCIENKTFDWKTTVRDIHIGIDEFKVSLMNENLWTEDLTVGFEGRYYTLTIPRKITTEWRQDQIYLDLNPNMIYDVYIHETNYFIINSHSFGLPLCHKEITPDPRGRYFELILTEHDVLNLPENPCEVDKNYNFQVNYKNENWGNSLVETIVLSSAQKTLVPVHK